MFAPGQMTDMAITPINPLKNLLLQNQFNDDLETWYEALGTPVLPWFKLVDLDLLRLGEILEMLEHENSWNIF